MLKHNPNGRCKPKANNEELRLPVNKRSLGSVA